ncbi:MULTISPECIES: hypothetical protein [unclassified Caballeronia]|uniref:hypothetical protein n=1 Tax=unclassified Caballeronia TaxID=2646786 RepID=UPI0020287B0A|nr:MULTISPECIES: hypothetical protein [unclassified Caballeronia]MDR5785017.1 hypothetical protein [Caballeronia sp. LP003]
MLKPPVNVFVIGKTLIQAKETMVNFAIEKAKSEGTNVVAAERKGASAFLEYAKNQFGLSKTTTPQYVRVYERFVGSRHRAEMEALFSPSELAVLAAYSDDELTEVVSAKAANPSLTRDGIKQLLKTRQAA